MGVIVGHGYGSGTGMDTSTLILKQQGSHFVAFGCLENHLQGGIMTFFIHGFLCKYVGLFLCMIR
jgi:hypothetical protein